MFKNLYISKINDYIKKTELVIERSGLNKYLFFMQLINNNIKGIH